MPNKCITDQIVSKLDQDEIDALKVEGNEHYKNGQTRKAIEQYKKALAKMQVQNICSDNDSQIEWDDKFSRKKAILFKNIGLCHFKDEE